MHVEARLWQSAAVAGYHLPSNAASAAALRGLAQRASLAGSVPSTSAPADVVWSPADGATRRILPTIIEKHLLGPHLTTAGGILEPRHLYPLLDDDDGSGTRGVACKTYEHDRETERLNAPGLPAWALVLRSPWRLFRRLASNKVNERRLTCFFDRTKAAGWRLSSGSWKIHISKFQIQVFEIGGRDDDSTQRPNRCAPPTTQTIMPVSADYSWSETEDCVELSIPLKGVSPKKVDVFTASTIVKVSFAPFLLDLNLHGEIDEERSRAVLKNGTLRIRLAKRQAGLWGKLCFEGTKEETKARRRKALEERDARVEERDARVQKKKVEEERMVFRQHMALEEKERQRLDDVKAAEKQRAEDEIYNTFSRLKDESNGEGGSAQRATKKQVHFKPDDGVSGDPENATEESTTKSNEPPQDCSQEDDTQPEPELPPPRKATQATFRHTPRLFKTPSRESTVKQEQEFILKNRSTLKGNALLNVDIGDADPAWLTAKGDEFYRKGDFCSAVNAYTEALVADDALVRTLANRAACYLHLREGACCIRDCLAVLKLDEEEMDRQLSPTEDQVQLQKDTHMRLALSYCLNEEHARGKEHFTKALQLDEEDQTAADCLSHLETLVEATSWKAKADASFADGDLAKAKELYTEALAADPTFVKARMNRAACELALGDSAGCIDDCSQSLEMLSPGNQKHSCVLAAILCPKPCVRRKWIVTLLCRRAAAKRLGEDFREALADLEEARTAARRGDAIDVGAIEKSISALKEEMTQTGVTF
ncbi:hypothetical protein ACHAXT_001368 [Thalassiosira profunda]